DASSPPPHLCVSGPPPWARRSPVPRAPCHGERRLGGGEQPENLSTRGDPPFHERPPSTTTGTPMMAVASSAAPPTPAGATSQALPIVEPTHLVRGGETPLARRLTMARGAAARPGLCPLCTGEAPPSAGACLAGDGSLRAAGVSVGVLLPGAQVDREGKA